MRTPRPFSLNKESLQKDIKEPYFLGLDFDGTLAPIVKNPAKARMPVRIKNRLVFLNSETKNDVAIVSGRSIRQLRKMAGTSKLTLIGNHGLECLDPKRGRWKHPKLRAALKGIQKARLPLRRLIRRYPGAVFEDKGSILAVHYRLLPAKKIAPLWKEIRDLHHSLKLNSTVQFGSGKKVWELRPRIRWNKGNAVQRFLKSRGNRYGSVIYLGDDLTDEDVFRKLKKSAFTVAVGKRHQTAAAYFLKSPSEVHRLIEILSGGDKGENGKR